MTSSKKETTQQTFYQKNNKELEKMKEIIATMAGTVLNVLVTNGDKVHTGQEVLMLESMKMEIPIESETDGTIKELKVNIGDFVNEGDVLIIVE
jgi:acetyl-CoA carboxylase biotin carboxyl carrier protein